MRKLITTIVILSFAAGATLKAQNESPVTGINTLKKPGQPANMASKPPQSVHKSVVPAPPVVPKIHAPSRLLSGYEIIDSTYNWISESFLPVWGNPETRYINYVYDGNHNITSYEKDTLNGSAWVNENRYYYTYNSSDSVAAYVVQQWSGSAWVNYDSSIYTYNTSGQITQKLDEEWTGSAWVDNDLYTNTYATTGQPTLQEYQNFVSGAWSHTWEYQWTYTINNQISTEEYSLGSGTTWTPDYLYTYAYNSSGYETLDEYETYSGSAWVYQSETVTSYNSGNLEDSILDLIGGGGTTWVNNGLSTYSYNSYNQETVELAQYWTGGVWVTEEEFNYTYSSTSSPSSEPATVIYYYYNPPLEPLDEQFYTYTGSGNVATYIDLNYNSSTSLFDTVNQTIYTYNSSNLPLNDLEQSYSSGVWTNSSQLNYTYNSYNQQTLELSQNWVSGAWANYYELITTYNTNDFEVFYEYQTANGSGTWEPQDYNTWEYNTNNFLQAYSYAADESTNDSTYHYFNSASAIKPIAGLGNNMLLYPNPNSGTFTIQSSVVNGELSVEVYNMIGERVYQTQISNFNSTANIALDAPNGVYFIRVLSEKQGVVMNGKIVIQR